MENGIKDADSEQLDGGREDNVNDEEVFQALPVEDVVKVGEAHPSHGDNLPTKHTDSSDPKLEDGHVTNGDGPKSYMGSFTRFLFVMGMWTRKGKYLSPLFYFVAPAYVFFFAISFFEITHNWGDLTAMTETLDMTLIFAVTGHKVLHLMWFEKKWKDLVQVVERSFERPHQRENSVHRGIMDQSVRSGRRFGIIWGVLAGATLTSFTIMPIAKGFLRRRAAEALEAQWNATDAPHVDVTTAAASVSLGEEIPNMWSIPYRTWTPFDHWTGVPYVLVYLLHLYIASLQVIVVPGFDSLMIALINYTCGQFRILQLSLLHLRKDCKDSIEKNGYVQKDSGHILLPEVILEEDDTEAGPILDKEMQNRVRDLVDHHEILLKFVQEVEVMVNKILLNQFFCSSVIICTSAFQLTMRHIGVAKLISMGELLVAALFELGMFCYFSNLLIDESTHVGYTVYCSEWFHSSISFRRSASLIMSRARKPCFVTFGGFSALSMETYAGILRISYTYFTVLNGMNE